MAVGYFAAPYVGSGFQNYVALPDHRTIIESINVIDMNGNVELTPVLVHSTMTEWGEGLPYSTFTYGETYGHSTWIWQRHGDTEICMTIWGSGSDGETFLIEIGVLGADPFNVMVNNELRGSITEGSYKGLGFTVKVTG